MARCHICEKNLGYQPKGETSDGLVCSKCVHLHKGWYQFVAIKGKSFCKSELSLLRIGFITRLLLTILSSIVLYSLFWYLEEKTSSSLGWFFRLSGILVLYLIFCSLPSIVLTDFNPLDIKRAKKFNGLFFSIFLAAFFLLWGLLDNKEFASIFGYPHQDAEGRSIAYLLRIRPLNNVDSYLPPWLVYCFFAAIIILDAVLSFIYMVITDSRLKSRAIKCFEYCTKDLKT